MKAALVTGGTGGIGAQISRTLAREGFRVLLAGRDPERGGRLAAELVAAGGRAEFVRCDLATQAGVADLAAAVEAALAGAGLDALVNNLGGVTTRRQLNADGVETIFAGNYLHPLLLACRLLPALRRARGRVVQMSTAYHHLVRLTRADLAGRRWDCGMNVYGRAKLLAVRVGGAVGRIWAAQGVGWHFADPGMAETPLTRSMSPLDFPWYGRFLFGLVRHLQRPIPLSWCASSSVALLTRAVLPEPSGVYCIPGPFLLPRVLVGYDDRAGWTGLRPPSAGCGPPRGPWWRRRCAASASAPAEGLAGGQGGPRVLRAQVLGGHDGVVNARDSALDADKARLNGLRQAFHGLHLGGDMGRSCRHLLAARLDLRPDAAQLAQGLEHLAVALVLLGQGVLHRGQHLGQALNLGRDLGKGLVGLS